MIEPKFDSLPEFLSSHDLVTLGLFPSVDSVYFARVRGQSPDFIKLGRKIIYPKSCVLQFIECRMKNGSTPSSNSDKQVQ